MLIPVVIDPEKPIVEDNILCIDGTQRCPHLTGDKPGEYFCKIHHYEWFAETPCGQFSQIEREDSDCRIDAHLLQKNF
jgi:hypothetical protein